MRKTNVRRHFRKVNGKIVPVRKHKRKIDKKLRKHNIGGFTRTRCPDCGEIVTIGISKGHLSGSCKTGKSLWEKDLGTEKRKNRGGDWNASGKIVPEKEYGETILIEDSKGKKYSTKNIGYVGARTLFDGEAIHGKDKKPDIKLDYEVK